MAKPLMFTLSNQSFSLTLGSKIEKSALYGYAKRIAEKDGKELSRGVLLPDGKLLPRSAIAYPKADDHGSAIEEPVAHVAGNSVAQISSSFDRSSELRELAMAQLALFATRDVYPLQAEHLPAPGLYETQFNYRAGYQTNEARILVRTDGLAFLLVGASKASKAVQLAVNYAFFDSDEEAEVDSDELDFSMV
jgi:hypothetical protein